MSDSGEFLLPGLSVGIAWNGTGDPEPALRGLEALDYVACALLSPSSAKAEKSASALTAKYPKLRVLPGGDTGIYSAWNKLIFNCGTRHLCFHGIDDFAVEVDGLRERIEICDSETMIVLDAAVTTQWGKEIFMRFDAETSPPHIELGRYRAPIGPNVLYPIRVLRAIGGADESFRIAGDVDMFFRARALARRIDLPATFVRMTDGGMSAAAKHAGTVYRENRRIARRSRQQVPLRKVMMAAAFLRGRQALYRLFGARVADEATDLARALAGRPRRYSSHAP